jgi:hypothetical protein
LAAGVGWPVHKSCGTIFPIPSTTYKITQPSGEKLGDKRKSEGITMRIEINRANAQHSTGPRTDEGKAKSSRNATRHGLTGKKVVINGEDEQAYESLRRDLLNAYEPANAAEAMLVDEIAQSFWRLQRARALEAEQFNLCCAGADPIIGFNSGNADFERLRRYMTSIERAYHRAIQQLEKTQSLRQKQDPPPAAEQANRIATRKHANVVGFVSQNPAKPNVIAMRNPGIALARAA